MAAATTLLIIISFFFLCAYFAEAQIIGVCYGRKGDNLPCAQDVVRLYKSNGIKAMRLYDPDLPTLRALQGSDIKVMLGVLNGDIESIACNQSIANEWVHANVVPFAPSIKYIAVGNEVDSTSQEASSVEPTMQNILNALNSNHLGSQIMVSTAIDTGLIQNSYPPSHAEFKNLTYITPIINFLTTNESPLLVNIQPYTAYINDPEHITPNSVLFTSQEIVANDTYNGLMVHYYNLFDAIYDAVYVAIQKVVTPCQRDNNLIFDGCKANYKPKKPAASESGLSSGFSSKAKINVGRMTENSWEKQGMLSKGENIATPENAKTYYTNLIKHINSCKGTPLNPGIAIETYLFAMFDEDLKPEGDGTERHYGLFTNDGHPKYGQLDFS